MLAVSGSLFDITENAEGQTTFILFFAGMLGCLLELRV